MKTTHVLVVDDLPQIRGMLSVFLRKVWGFLVTEAGTAAEALELYRNEPETFDIVLLDFEIGRASGVGLLEEFYALRPDTCPLLITASAQEALAELEACCLDVPVLSKPFTLDALRQAMERLIEHRRQLDAHPWDTVMARAGVLAR